MVLRTKNTKFCRMLKIIHILEASLWKRQYKLFQWYSLIKSTYFYANFFTVNKKRFLFS